MGTQISGNYPRISIVTPSLNQAKFLCETIESVLNQNYPNLEYIIIDGGSTDGSVEIIKRYKRHLAYWISEKDSGQSEAINKGIARATGDLFNWINSDDLLFPGALHRIAAAFLWNPNADFIIGDSARSDAEGRIIWVSAVPSRLTMQPSGWVFWVGQQSTFISLTTLRRVGRLREDLHCIMDADLYYRIFSARGSFVRVNGLVGVIREHPDAKGIARKAEWRPEAQRVFEEYRIGPFCVKVALAKMRSWRVLDGSYFRSWLLLRRWRGRRPWEGT